MQELAEAADGDGGLMGRNGLRQTLGPIMGCVLSTVKHMLYVFMYIYIYLYIYMYNFLIFIYIYIQVAIKKWFYRLVINYDFYDCC